MLLRDKGLVDRELYWKIRKKIRMRDFKSKANLKEFLRDKVDLDKVWEVIKKDLPELKVRIEEIKTDLEDAESRD